MSKQRRLGVGRAILAFTILLIPIEGFSQIDVEYNKKQEQLGTKRNKCMSYYNSAQFVDGNGTRRYLIDQDKKIFFINYIGGSFPCTYEFSGMILNRESNGKLFKIDDYKYVNRTDNRDCISVLFLYRRVNGSIIREIQFPVSNGGYPQELYHVCK